MVNKVNENTFQIGGRINSNTADEFEKTLFQVVGDNCREITLDAGALEYISSAGLRVLLKLKKKMKAEVNIINVSPENYEVLEVTGFSTLFNVKKKLREISVEGKELIGKGGNGSVYRISEDEIIKVYTSKTTMASIEKERELARNAFLAGVPTAITYDVVKVGDSLGIVFEMVKADVIGRKFMAKDGDFDLYARKYAELLKEIHSVELFDKGIPSTKHIYREYLDQIGDWYDRSEKEQIGRFIDQIPERDTMVHGDYHTNNIMVQGEELLLIDMAEISYGHPVFDLASSYYAHVLNARRDPNSVMRYLNVDAPTAMKLWDVIMRVYFDTEDPEQINRYNQVIEGFCLLKSALVPAIWVNMPPERKAEAVKAAKEFFLPRTDQIIKDVIDMFRK